MKLLICYLHSELILIIWISLCFTKSLIMFDESQQHNDSGGLRTEQEIAEWLPISSNRKAKWWYATFHNVTAVVGAGVLGLPYAFSQLGWCANFFLLVFLFVLYICTETESVFVLNIYTFVGFQESLLYLFHG